ncbi:MAG: hypothetical protein ACYS22_00265, partial [Planctomycetota bacterium]
MSGQHGQEGFGLDPREIADPLFEIVIEANVVPRGTVSFGDTFTGSPTARHAAVVGTMATGVGSGSAYGAYAGHDTIDLQDAIPTESGTLHAGPAFVPPVAPTPPTPHFTVARSALGPSPIQNSVTSGLLSLLKVTAAISAIAAGVFVCAWAYLNYGKQGADSVGPRSVASVPIAVGGEPESAGGITSAAAEPEPVVDESGSSEQPGTATNEGTEAGTGGTARPGAEALASGTEEPAAAPGPEAADASG